MHAFDRRTDRQTDRNLIVRPRLHSMQRGKNEEIRKRVNLSETVVEVIRRRRLTWFGHVSRMSGDRLSTRALHCYIRSRGRPCKKWINNIHEDLNCLQLNMKEAMDIVRDRQEWRHRISTSSSPLGWRASKKKKKIRSVKLGICPIAKSTMTELLL